jgi:hypothetical protein
MYDRDGTLVMKEGEKESRTKMTKCLEKKGREISISGEYGAHGAMWCKQSFILVRRCHKLLLEFLVKFHLSPNVTSIG